MSAFFWVPAVLELPLTVFYHTKISDYTRYFADFNLIGISTLLIFAAGGVAFIKNKDLIKNHRLTLIFFGLGVLSIFLATSLSSFLWSVLPVSFIQFPFRFLSVTIVCAAFVFAFVNSQISLKFRIVFGLTIVVLTIFLSKNYLMPKEFSLKDDSFYSTNEATTTVQDEYMPIWVKAKPQSHFNDKVAISRGEGSVGNISYNSKKISFNYLSDEPSVVRISTIYYPGWTAESNVGEKAIFYDNEQGLIDVKLTSADKKITLVFGEIPSRYLADAISALAFVWMFTLVFKDRLLVQFKT